MQATSSMQLGSRYHIRAAVRVLQQGGLVIASLIEDGLSPPRTTSEEAPFAVRATACDDAPFVFRASLPVKSPNCLLRCGDSKRPRVPRGVLWFSADPFVPPSPAHAGCVIGSRGDHRRDRTVAIDRISRHHSNLRVPALGVVALIHQDFDQVEARQPVARENRFSRPALPTVSRTPLE